MTRTFRSLMSALCVGIAATAASFSAFSPAVSAAAAPAEPPMDKITQKDGTVLQGRITKEVEGWIWFTKISNGIETALILNPKDIEQIERASKAPAAGDEPEPAPPKDADAARKPRAPGGAPRAAVLTLEGMVGMQMAAKPLEDAIPLLEEENVDIVVLKINSGGGFLLEIQKLSDVIHEKYKKKFRTVGWIESAISAAAMTAHCLEEIYFMPEGNYGGCTGWSGSLEAVKGRGLEEVLLMMEKISARGNHPKQIMRAMQISSDENELQTLGISPPGGQLSADINPVTGEVTWYQSLEGKHVLNPKGGVKILTFNAEEASKFKFSRGTAADVKELASAMLLPEIEWVGKEKKGVTYPICKAEEYQIKWRKDVTDAEDNFGVYMAEYQRNVGTAQGTQDRTDRGLWIGKAKRSLEFIKTLCKKHPNIGLLNFNGQFDDWYREQEEMLRKLAR